MENKTYEQVKAEAAESLKKLHEMKQKKIQELQERHGTLDRSDWHSQDKESYERHQNDAASLRLALKMINTHAPL